MGYDAAHGGIPALITRRMSGAAVYPDSSRLRLGDAAITPKRASKMRRRSSSAA